MRGQRPQRGYLGVGLQPLDENLAPSLGLPKDSGEIVRSVVPGGPAARAGLQQGDVIVQVNGQQVTPDADRLLSDRQHHGRLASSARDHPRRAAGDRHRRGRRTPDRGAAGQAQRRRHGHWQSAPALAAVAPQKALGLSLAPLTPELARAANLPRRHGA